MSRHSLRLLILTATLAAALPLPLMAEPAPAPTSADWKAHLERICTDHYAGIAGHLGFIEAKLTLSAEQSPAFRKWRDGLLSRAKTLENECLAKPLDPAAHPTALDREARAEKQLEAHLAALKAERPDLEALYQALTPAQKTVLDEFHGDWQGHRGEGHFPHGPHGEQH